MPNPDGTVQVAPPTMSAFSPQASASAPPPPQAQPAVQPGFMEALMQMFHQLTQALNPAQARAPRATEQAIEAQSGGNPAQLGQSFHQ
jgi:hypothetical protein